MPKTRYSDGDELAVLDLSKTYSRIATPATKKPKVLVPYAKPRFRVGDEIRKSGLKGDDVYGNVRLVTISGHRVTYNVAVECEVEEEDDEADVEILVWEEDGNLHLVKRARKLSKVPPTLVPMYEGDEDEEEEAPGAKRPSKVEDPIAATDGKHTVWGFTKDIEDGEGCEYQGIVLVQAGSQDEARRILLKTVAKSAEESWKKVSVREKHDTFFDDRDLYVAQRVGRCRIAPWFSKGPYPFPSKLSKIAFLNLEMTDLE